jgi:ferredoxin
MTRELHGTGDGVGGMARPRRDRPGPGRHHGTDGINAVKVQISSERCQGHGRCYDLAPGLFGEDDEGYGTVLADGVVLPGEEQQAYRAAANCPEHAIEVVRESRHDRR